MVNVIAAKKQFDIQRVSSEEIQAFIRNYAPRGRFLAKEGRKWVAVDNSTGDAWTEEFRSKRQAVRWLRGKFEVGNRAKVWDWINDAKTLISVALRQGIRLRDNEADIILGYVEGHEYSLMTNDAGELARHNDQYGDNHRGDEAYTVWDAIVFCQERNEELIADSSEPEYLSQLQKDEQHLDALMARLVEGRADK